jgi:hypothetical protein
MIVRNTIAISSMLASINECAVAALPLALTLAQPHIIRRSPFSQSFKQVKFFKLFLLSIYSSNSFHSEYQKADNL